MPQPQTPTYMSLSQILITIHLPPQPRSIYWLVILVAAFDFVAYPSLRRQSFVTMAVHARLMEDS